MAELGALSLRIEENGGTAVLQKLNQIDAAAKVTGVTVDTAAKALTRLGISAKVSGGQIVVAESEVARAASIVKQLGSDAVVTAGQVDQAAVSVGRLGTRAATTDAAVTKMSPKLRSGASAISALAIAAATGGGSLTGMATQAGLVGSVMAAEFAPAKWAGYAAGIGAVVIGITALVGIIAKLRAEQAKPSEFTIQRIADIKQLQLAEEEYNKRRADTEKARAADMEMRRRLAGSPTSGMTQEAARLKKAEAIETEALKKLQELRNTAIKEDAELAKSALVQVAENTKTIRLSALASEQAEVEKRFQEGTASIADQYDKRRQVIVDGANAERAALEAARAQKLKPVAGETPQDARGRQIEAGAISAQITALAADTQAKLTALTTQRAADEKALAAKVIAYEAQVEAVKDRSFEKRREQIQAEAEERRKAVFQQTGDEAAAETARAELVRRRTDELLLQKAQTDLSRLQADLDTKRQGIQNQLAAGKLTEREAAQAIADIERSALPTLQQTVALATQFATALGDEGALTGLRELQAQLEGLGTLLSPLEQRIRDLFNNIESSASNTMAAVGNRIRDMIAEAGGEITVDIVLNAEALAMVAADVDRMFATLGQGFGNTLSASIAAAASGGSGSEVLLRGLGSIMQQMGATLITYGLTMSGLLPALLNPFTSGPAAIAAGVALTALGAALGAAASGKGGGGGSVGRSAAAASTPVGVTRLIIDPNAGMKQRLASAGSMAVAGGGPSPKVYEVIGINTPRGQELIGTANDRYTRRRS